MQVTLRHLSCARSFIAHKALYWLLVLCVCVEFGFCRRVSGGLTSALPGLSGLNTSHEHDSCPPGDADPERDNHNQTPDCSEPKAAASCGSQPANGNHQHSQQVTTHSPTPHYAARISATQGFRRLVANRVKCSSNYSELSTYHEYGNIFTILCTVFALQKPKVITSKQSLETSSQSLD